jgi:hypothetical protein
MGTTSMDANTKGIYYWLYVIAFFVVLAISVALWLWVLKRRQQKIDLEVCRRYLPLLAIAITPFLRWQLSPWLSSGHPFVFRELAVFLFSLGAFYILTCSQAGRSSEERSLQGAPL